MSLTAYEDILIFSAHAKKLESLGCRLHLRGWIYALPELVVVLLDRRADYGEGKSLKVTVLR